MKSVTKDSFMKNMIYAMGAQGVSILLSIFLALIFPKLLGVHHYSYWRLFSLYIAYAPVASLGLNDGIYLRCGGKDYRELDFPLLKSGMLISLFWHMLIGSLVLWLAFCSFELEQERFLVLICTAVYIVLTNMVSFLHSALQSTNRIKDYSGAVLMEKLCFLIVVLVGILVRCKSLEVYLLSFIVSRILSLIYCLWLCKDILKCRCASWTLTFQEVIANVSSGINLMISNFTNMLLLGIAQFMIDAHWGVEAFGMFSLALALSEFFVVFISQTSVVLFPEFRRMEKEALSNSFRALRTGFGALLLLAMFGYLPMWILVELWMPQYEECLKYLILLFPICVFDGKMGMLCNTYFKALRREKDLLIINVFSLIVGTLIYAFAAFVLDNILLIGVGMMVTIGIRSVIAEWYLAGIFEKDTMRIRIWEIVLVVIFVVSTWFLGPVWGFALYFVAYAVFCASYKTQLKWLLEYGRLKG